MTDRELLELAATASKMTVWFPRMSDGKGGVLEPCHYTEDGITVEWNPLADDGDALRLAVKLEIAINPYAGKVVVWSEANRMAGHEKWDSDDEACEAVRRAIVRAAAEIGKEMK